MQNHFHFDGVSALYIGTVAVITFNVLRLFAAWLVSKGIGAGQTLGALVT